jgi:hypothetical protein
MIGDSRGARDTVAPWLRSPDGDMMAYGLLCGVMVAQGRFGEARQWLGRAGHVRHLYQKLGAHSRGEAVERARAFGLLTSWPRSG